MDQSKQKPALKLQIDPPPPLQPGDFFLRPEIYFPALMLQHPEYFQINQNLVRPLPRQMPWSPMDLRQNAQQEGLAQRLSPGLVDLSKNSTTANGVAVKNASINSFAVNEVPLRLNLNPIPFKQHSSEVKIIDTNYPVQPNVVEESPNTPLNLMPKTEKISPHHSPTDHCCPSPKSPENLSKPKEKSNNEILFKKFDQEPSNNPISLPALQIQSAEDNSSILQKNPANVAKFLPQDDEEESAYAEFRQKILAQLQMNHNRSNENMRRNINGNNPNVNDPMYLEKRRKNNEAAKRSRDARKLKEDEIAIRCAFLEQINLKLKLEFAEIEKEKRMLSNHFGRLKR